MSNKKKFIITIDTEGDDLWNNKITRMGIKPIYTQNAKGLERFQTLCEKYGFIPTYLTNYEMSTSTEFINLAKYAIRKSAAEVGMHMHAWNSPPIVMLPYNSKGTHTYLGEYEKKIQWEKMKYLCNQLEDIFQIKITSFRSGRWYFDEFILRCLKKLGIIVDCSITPRISWGDQIGNHLYGTDYSHDKYKGCYQLSGKDIHKCGKSGVYEVPPTILTKTSIHSLRVERKKVWLRPDGHNLEEMLWIADKISKNKNIDYLEFMIHSSELYPGVNPTFRTQKSIEKLYDDLEILFSRISQNYVGIGLSDYTRNKML